MGFIFQGAFFSFRNTFKNEKTKNDVLKNERRALKNGAYTTNLEPVNSDLNPFYAFSVLSVLGPAGPDADEGQQTEAGMAPFNIDTML